MRQICHCLLRVLPILLILMMSNNRLLAQKMSGLQGKYWLLGYESNYKYGQGNSQSTKPLATRLQHKFYVERLINQKWNLGFAITRSKATINFEQFAYNYILHFKDIEIDHNNTTMYLDDLQGMNQLTTLGYELSMKRYFNANVLRNYGWYFTYKYGRLNLQNQILPGAIIQAHKTTETYWDRQTYAYSNNKVYKSKVSYIGIDLGKTYPLHHSNLLFSASFSYNIFFNKTKTDNSFESHINKIAGRHVARRHILMFNAGIAYVL